jgi:hypothetical protein
MSHEPPVIVVRAGANDPLVAHMSLTAEIA